MASPPVAAPAWLAPYTGEQQALIDAPTESPIPQPARNVYPELTRFLFIGEAPLNVPDDLVGYAGLITRTLEESRYLYVFRTGPETIANPNALWGPAPGEVPDPWKRMELTGDRAVLVDAAPDAADHALFESAPSAAPKDTLVKMREAATKYAALPGVQTMLADAAIAAGDLDTATQAAEAALKIDPRFPLAHRALAEVHLRRNDKAKARASLARALAAYPAYARAWQVAEVLMNRPLERPVDVPAPFIEVTRQGAVLVVSCERALCEGYAACKAAFRYEPGLRTSVLHEADTEPYHLSVTEEVVCLEAGLGAHLASRTNPDPAQPHRPDPTAELLVRLAKEKGLTAYAMFEILGRRRPEWMRVAPTPAYDLVVQYVLDRVLVEAPSTPPAAASSNGVTAERWAPRVVTPSGG